MQLIALLTVLGLATAAPDGDKKVPGAKADWRAKADRILDLPKGSVSLGHTSGGSLHAAVRMPSRGKGFALLPHIPSRKTRYATDEMVGLVERTANRVRKKYKWATLRIGNISYRQGGRIPWSVSHRAGRDVDIAFFTVNAKGRPVRLKDYVTFDRKGHSQDGLQRFDTTRNLEVVRALLSDETVHVQWIFVSRHLRRKLLRAAKRKKVPADMVRRMETVMRQPSDSAPHNDHFHVRIYCSPQDVLHGCHNRGPFHDWVTPATEAYRQRLSELRELTKAPLASYRRRAIDKLVALNARSATDSLIAALDDNDDRVFKAAIRALRRLMPNSTIPALAAPLARQTTPARAAAIMKLLARRGTEQAAELALGVLTAPAKTLSRKLDSVGKRAATWLAALPLVAKHGRKAEALALVDKVLPGLGRVDLLVACHDALKNMTNNDVASRQGKRRRLRRIDKGIVERWTAFAKKHARDSWLQWLRVGFEARGFRFKKRMWSSDSIPTLIRAAAHRDPWVNRNAVRVLNGLTGQSIDPDRRTRTWRARHFRKYWKRHRRAQRSRSARR